MPLPVEVDIAVGIHGQRVAWHYEAMEHVDPVQFVEVVKEAVLDALGSPVSTGETQQVQTGSVATDRPRDRGCGESGEGGSAVSVTSATGPPEPVTVEVGAPRGRPSKPRKPKAAASSWPPDIETREERLARIQRQREERLASRLRAS